MLHFLKPRLPIFIRVCLLLSLTLFSVLLTLLASVRFTGQEEERRRGFTGSLLCRVWNYRRSQHPWSARLFYSSVPFDSCHICV